MEGSTLAVDGVASNPSAAILTAPVSDASAWRAADFIADRSWIVALTEAAVAEVDAALRHAQRQGKTAQTITRDGFPLTSVGGLLADARHELEYGRGFLLLRGLPIDRYTDEEAGLLYRGTCCRRSNAARRCPRYWSWDRSQRRLTRRSVDLSVRKQFPVRS
jgi:hypothetical protein